MQKEKRKFPWKKILLIAAGVLLAALLLAEPAYYLYKDVTFYWSDRTETEKQFGIQIDSLCDVISFGIFPAVICITMGLDSLADYCLLAIYCLCCVIRLGYFNVLAQNEEPEAPKGYHGLPVVGLAMFLPAAFLLGMWIPPVAFRVLLRCMLILFGCLYILDFRVKKPKMWILSLLAAVYLIPMTLILLRK